MIREGINHILSTTKSRYKMSTLHQGSTLMVAIGQLILVGFGWRQAQNHRLRKLILQILNCRTVNPSDIDTNYACRGQVRQMID